MKSFHEFILEKQTTVNPDVNQDIIKLSVYILDYMKKNNEKKSIFNISKLSIEFPFLKNWDFQNICVYVNPNYTNKTTNLTWINSIGIFIKSYSRSTLNHELIHALQLSKNKNILISSYENEVVLSQIQNFFRKNRTNINLLKNMLYFSDEREMEAFIHSFRKESKDKKIEILSYVLLLKYFNLKNLISDEQSLRQFITIWKEYYGTSIPFFDRMSLQRRITSNTLELNQKEIEKFIKNINHKLNKIGNIYMEKLIKQYSSSEIEAEKFINQNSIIESEIEKFIKLLNKAKLNIVRNNFKGVIDISNVKNIKLPNNQSYNMRKNWDH